MKRLYWVGSSQEDLRRFPRTVKHVAGYALYLAQQGGKHPDAKPLKGFSGAGTLEMIVDCRGDTYRTVYTVSFGKAVYVLHAFQKRSKHGISTPRHEIELIRKRLDMARSHYAGIKDGGDE